MFDSLVFSATQWSLPAALLVVGCTLLALWSYLHSRGPTWMRLAAATLKLFAFAILALCLIEPVQRWERPLPGANTLAILVDNSSSMQLRPSGESLSRAEQLREILPADTAWQMRLSQDFSVKKYLFDQRLQAVENLGLAEFQGQYSMLGSALSSLKSRFANQPMAGVVLLTDGIATDLLKLDNELFKQFPIYPVVNIGQSTFKDISIGQTSVSLSSFELSPATVEASIQCQGIAGREVTVRIFDSTGKTLEKKSFLAESDDFQQRLKFQFRPPAVGWQAVQLRALLSSEDAEAVEATSQVEVTSRNNIKLLGIDRGGGPFRILYVAGRPNWEFKFLRRALDEDPELELQGLIRVAKKEPRFSFGDRSVGDVNPLVAGFSDNPDTAEKVDEPVLIKIGVDSESDLQAGLPSSAQDLFTYHAIILDDIESNFFTSQQMLLIRQFVAERGGGFLMLGGQESFMGGNYEGTPLGDLLPVYLRGGELSQLKNIPAQYSLSREGELQPWLRLRATKPEELERFAQMPSFQTWNTVAEIKPGAATLANLEIEGRSLPGLVSQRFGKGQSAALMIGDFWRWSMRRQALEKDDLAQTWRQLARWLTSDVPRRVELEITPPPSPTEPHRLTVELRDEEFKPLDNAQVIATVVDPAGKETQVSFQTDSQVSGRYWTDFWSRLDGAYTCKLVPTGPDGVELDVVETGWTAQPSAAEFTQVVPDVKLLQRIADRSGGELIPFDKLDEFVSSLPSRKVPITETRIEPWWHRPWLLLVALSCLCAEWGLRRWKGLP